jgi:uncharacterized protein (TIGR02246 family)
MTIRQRRLSAVAVAVGLAALFFVVLFRAELGRVEAAGQAGSTPAGDEAAIRAASRAYLESLEKGDLDGIMAHWADDADFIDEGGKITRGKAQLAARFKESLPDVKGAKFSGKMTSIKFLRPEICLVDGTLRPSCATAPKSRAGTQSSGPRWAQTG